jgi:CRP/FNR family cyclic AMP-dependent transcriptional regulator
MNTKGPRISYIYFLAIKGPGRKFIHLRPAGLFFSQGAKSRSIFPLTAGRAKFAVVSKHEKVATVTLLSAGEFIGKESIADAVGLRMANASTIIHCIAMKINRAEMTQAICDDTIFSNFFISFFLGRCVRTQADLIDQHFNSSKKRLARALLLMSKFGKPGEPETFIPSITQEALAEIIGTTRSRTSFYMNRFRELGFIKYHGRLRVRKSLLNIVLHDQFDGPNSERPPAEFAARTRTVPSKRRRPPG